MKKVFLTLSLALAAASAFGQSNTVVRWQKIVGVITAPGIDNPVAVTTDANGSTTNLIHSGGLPWTTRRGSARVNLSTGEGSFDVEGLVLVGGNATGTAGPVTSVVGTLVCNPGTADQTILDTGAANLSSAGNAELSFKLNVPPICNSPLFLIRAGVRWIATGAMRVTGNAFLTKLPEIPGTYLRERLSWRSRFCLALGWLGSAASDWRGGTPPEKWEAE